MNQYYDGPDVNNPYGQNGPLSPQQQYQNAVQAHYYKKEKSKLRWTGNALGFAVLGMFVVSLLFALALGYFGGLMGLYSQSGEFIGDDIIYQLISLIEYIPMLILPFFLYALIRKISIADSVPLTKPRKGLFLPGVFVGMGGCAVGSLLTTFISMLMLAFGFEITGGEIEVPASLAGQLLLLLNVGILPAFIEEIIFRGIVMQPLRRYGDGFAIVMSALVFGLVHGNLVQIPFAVVVGLVIGFFVVRCESLWVGIAIHMINNTMSVILTILQTEQNEMLMGFVILGYYGILIILAIPFIGHLFDKQRWIFWRNPVRPVLPLGSRVGAFILNPGMILALIMIVLVTSQYVKYVGIG